MTTESMDLMTELKATANPFPGLRPFQLNESHLYFGRDGQSEQLLRKLSQTRFVTVVGTSGSGKSSLVRAGLQPALYGGLMASAGSDWRIAIMRPGNDPIGNLSLALNEEGVFGSEEEDARSLQTTITEVTLRRGSLGLVEAVRQTRMPSHENLLVLVDQFEELFRFARVTDDPQYQNDAAAFVKLLLEAAQQREISIYVVLTLRSDFLGDCSLFWDLPEAINEGQYLIPRLTREQRREAITGPVAVGGAQITQRLVNCLLNDMGDNPDQLPILQHALMRTWNRWKETSPDTEPIDLEHYQAIGEMKEALSIHADEAYKELPDERSREIAEKIFRGLTEKGSDNRETRRPIVLKELCSLTQAAEAEVIAVIDIFRKDGRSFLMPPADVPLHADSLIDISHESLIRNWKRLNEWVDQEAQCARTYRRLAETAVLHAQGHAGLWRDPDLQLALSWREQSKPNKAWARRYHPEFETAIKFLDESVKTRDAEIVENERKRKREVRRARLTAIIFGLAFIFSLAALIFANNQRVKANNALSALARKTDALEKQNIFAEEQQRLAERKEKSARAATEYATEQREEADAQRQKAVAAQKQAERQTLIAARKEREARLSALAADTAAEAAQRAEREALISSENEKKATDSFRKQLYASNIGLATEAYKIGNVERADALLNASKTEREADDPRGFEWYYLSSLYHRKIDSFVAEESEGEIIASTAFSPDGKIFATGSRRAFKLWDAQTRQPLATLEEDEMNVEMGVVVAFSPTDNKLLATANQKGIKLWDVSSRRVLARLADGAPTNSRQAVVFSPNGARLAAWVKGQCKVWETASQKLIATIPPEPFSTSLIPDLAFSLDGQTLAFRTDEGVQLWDIDSQSLVQEIGGRLVEDFGFLSDDRFFISAFSVVMFFERESATSQWFIAKTSFEIPTGMARLINSMPSSQVLFSPDQKTFATAVETSVVSGGGVKLWDAKSRELLATFEGLGTSGDVSTLAFSPDGKTLAISSGGEVQFSDADLKRNSTEVVGEALAAGTEALRGPVGVLKISPDGTKFATLQPFMEGYLLKLWDRASLKLLDTFEGGIRASVLGRSGIAFSPDSRMLATGYQEGGVDLWDIGPHKLIATFKPPANSGSNERRTEVLSIAFSPDGKTLAVGGSDFFQWWDIATQKLLTAPENYGGAGFTYSRLAFSPDGKFVAVISLEDDGGGLQIIDATTRQSLVYIPYTGQAFPTCMAFSPDSKTLAATGSNSTATVDIWDISALKTGEQKPEFQQWERDSPQLKETLEGHEGFVADIDFSPDGKTLASGGGDKTVRLWSMTTYQQLLSLEAVNKVNAVAFSPDNQTLLAAGIGGFVKLWYAPRNAEKKTGLTIPPSRALALVAHSDTELAERAFPRLNLFAAITSRAWRDYSRVEMTHGNLTGRRKKTETSMKELPTLRPLWPEP